MGLRATPYPASANRADPTAVWVYFGAVAYAMSVPTDETCSNLIIFLIFIL